MKILRTNFQECKSENSTEMIAEYDQSVKNNSYSESEPILNIFLNTYL